MAKQIRTFGDPVLKSKALPVADVDGKAIRLVDEMFNSLYTIDNGLALAAPQIGVQKQVVVWDFGDDPQAIFNPEIADSDGEWVYEEGCLSIPGLYVEIVRPKTVLVKGVDLDGNAVEREADELEARHVPARARPPQRRADVRPHDARSAARSARRVPPHHRRGERPRTPPAVAPRLTSAALTREWCRSDSSTSARPRWPWRRCGRCTPPGTTSPSSSRSPTSGAAAAAPRRRAR